MIEQIEHGIEQSLSNKNIINHTSAIHILHHMD